MIGGGGRRSRRSGGSEAMPCRRGAARQSLQSIERGISRPNAQRSEQWQQGRTFAQPPDSPKQPPARVQAFGGLGALPTIKKRFTLYYMQQVREDT